ncbi:hypothetical protein [Micromonospora sp. WP24]|uniref:hypothetical protein n=1 Tax=Micromonospora sp. WP24 TaxID=2604469 RepID=UPI001651DF56
MLGVGWLLWQLAGLVNRLGDDLLRRLPLSRAQERAGFASFAVHARRVHVFAFAGLGFAVMAGYDASQASRCKPWQVSTACTVEADMPSPGASRRGPSLRSVRSWHTRASASGRVCAAADGRTRPSGHYGGPSRPPVKV